MFLHLICWGTAHIQVHAVHLLINALFFEIKWKTCKCFNFLNFLFLHRQRKLWIVNDFRGPYLYFDFATKIFYPPPLPEWFVPQNELASQYANLNYKNSIRSTLSGPIENRVIYYIYICVNVECDVSMLSVYLPWMCLPKNTH